MLISRFLLFTIVISIVWTIPDKENSITVRLKRQEYTFSSKSRLFPTSGTNGIISFCCLPEPKQDPKHQIQSATASYDVIGSISSEDFNRGLRIQVPIHTLKFGRNFVASQGTIREIPIPKEFRQHEIFLQRPPHIKYGPPAPVGGDGTNTQYTGGRSNSFTSYERPSFVEVSGDVYMTRTTRKSITNYGRPIGMTTEDEPRRTKVDYLNPDPQIEVMASEMINEIFNHRKRKLKL